ncbi:MAG: cytochrome c [Saprospirales bacterium]|nr:MAG: cytochrome c [Saprospirales bacterium]
MSKSLQLSVVLMALIIGAFTIFHSSCDFNPHRHGEWLFEIHCANCHMADGTGLGELIPDLWESPYLQKTTIHEAACLIRYGIKTPDPLDPDLKIYPMPPNYELTESEIANILNYIGNSFGNEGGYINPTTLKEVLSDCPNAEDRQW